MSINDKIKSRRAELQITLDEVARHVGTTRQTIQKYESGVIMNIPSDKIERLAEALKTTPAYLMGWEEKQKKDRPLTVSTTTEKDRLLNAFEKLNERGRDEAIKRVEEMAAVGYYLQQGNEDVS